jgi:uncharacterized protein (TIGR03437 family)
VFQISRFVFVCSLGFSGALQLRAQTTTPLKASPATLSFAYQEGDAKLPPAQTLALTGTAGSALTVTLAGGPWLTASPMSGSLPLSTKILANPTSLTVGTYTGTVTVATSGSNAQSVAIPVTLTVKAAPSSLTPSSTAIAITHTRGTSNPAPVALSLSSSGAVLSYSVTSAGGAWLAISPKSGIAFPAFPGTVMLTVNPAGLAPGAYKATLTIAAPQASNKSQTAVVNLTVNPGAPAITSIWPTRVTEGAEATTLTLTGSNFFTGSVIKAGTVVLNATVLGENAATAVVPAELLATAGAVALIVSNPGTGGGDSPAASLTVAAAAPVISAIVNAASFLDGPVAPGEMVTIFGTRLGPDDLASFIAPAPGQPIANTLSGTTVYFDTTPAPVIFTSVKQVAVMVPYNVAGKTSVAIRLDNSGTSSGTLTKTVALSAPAFFTAAGTGNGQLAALNIDATTGAYSLNTETATAAKGGVVVLYATGEGVPSPASTDGRIVTSATLLPNPALAVQIGGTTATVLYAGGVVGLVSGIIQINVRIPATITATKATPIVLTVNGLSSPPGTTIGVK